MWVFRCASALRSNTPTWHGHGGGGGQGLWTVGLAVTGLTLSLQFHVVGMFPSAEDVSKTPPQLLQLACCLELSLCLLKIHSSRCVTTLTIALSACASTWKLTWTHTPSSSSVSQLKGQYHCSTDTVQYSMQAGSGLHCEVTLVLLSGCPCCNCDAYLASLRSPFSPRFNPPSPSKKDKY
jgi:hypothetical protein